MPIKIHTRLPTVYPTVYPTISSLNISDIETSDSNKSYGYAIYITFSIIIIIFVLLIIISAIKNYIKETMGYDQERSIINQSIHTHQLTRQYNSNLNDRDSHKVADFILIDAVSLEPLCAPTRFLPCGHTFNHDTVVNLISHAENGIIKCPLDRKKIKVTSVYKFPRNNALEQQIDNNKQLECQVIQEVLEQITQEIDLQLQEADLQLHHEVNNSVNNVKICTHVNNKDIENNNKDIENNIQEIIHTMLGPPSQIY